MTELQIDERFQIPQPQLELRTRPWALAEGVLVVNPGLKIPFWVERENQKTRGAIDLNDPHGAINLMSGTSMI